MVAEAQFNPAWMGGNTNPLNIMVREWQSQWKLVLALMRQPGVIDGTCSAEVVLCSGLLSCQLCLPEALFDMLG